MSPTSVVADDVPARSECKARAHEGKKVVTHARNVWKHGSHAVTASATGGRRAWQAVKALLHSTRSCSAPTEAHHLLIFTHRSTPDFCQHPPKRVGHRCHPPKREYLKKLTHCSVTCFQFTHRSDNKFSVHPPYRTHFLFHPPFHNIFFCFTHRSVFFSSPYQVLSRAASSLWIL